MPGDYRVTGEDLLAETTKCDPPSFLWMFSLLLRDLISDFYCQNLRSGYHTVYILIMGSGAYQCNEGRRNEPRQSSDDSWLYSTMKFYSVDIWGKIYMLVGIDNPYNFPFLRVCYLPHIPLSHPGYIQSKNINLGIKFSLVASLSNNVGCVEA